MLTKLLNLLQGLSLGCLIILLAGCTEFTNPVGSKEAAPAANTLSGNWAVYKPDGTRVGKLMTEPGDDGSSKLMVSSLMESSEHSGTRLFFATHSGKNQYLNIIDDSSSGTPKYQILKYQVSADNQSYKTWEVSDAAIGKAISAKQIKGKKLASGWQITDTGNNILKWMDGLKPADWIAHYDYKLEW